MGLGNEGVIFADASGVKIVGISFAIRVNFALTLAGDGDGSGDTSFVGRLFEDFHADGFAELVGGGGHVRVRDAGVEVVGSYFDAQILHAIHVGRGLKFRATGGDAVYAFHGRILCCLDFRPFQVLHALPFENQSALLASGFLLDLSSVRW